MSDNVVKPQNLDERLIALVVNASGAREVFGKIKPEQIEDSFVRVIFDAALEVYERGGRRTRQINEDAIVEELKQREVFKGKEIDKSKLRRCLRGEVDRRNDLEQTITSVASRKVDKALKEKLENLRNASGEKAIHLASEIADLRKEKSGVAASKIIAISDWTDNVEDIWKPAESVKTGFPILDKRLGGGLIKGNYHLLVGHTGTGKTIASLTMFMNMIRSGVKALYFNYEVPFDYFRQIMFSQITSTNPYHFKYDDELKRVKEQQFIAEIEKLYEEGLLHVTDPKHGAPSVWDDSEEMMRDIIESHGAEMVFFDTINSVSARTKSGQDARWNEYETISIGAERLTMEYNVSLLFTAQPKQDPVTRDDPRPQLMDVAGGKTITEKAASVIHIHRADIFDPTGQTNWSEFVITKNRMFGSELGRQPIRIGYNLDSKSYYELPADRQGSYSEDLDTEGAVRPDIPPPPSMEIEKPVVSEDDNS